MATATPPGQASATVHPFHQLLAEIFREEQARDPRFNQEAFSAKLGVSRGAVSMVLNGSRPGGPGHYLIIGAMKAYPDKHVELAAALARG